MYSELFWAALSRIRTEYREIRSISPYSVESGKIRIRITPNTKMFHAVIFATCKISWLKKDLTRLVNISTIDSGKRQLLCFYSP